MYRALLPLCLLIGGCTGDGEPAPRDGAPEQTVSVRVSTDGSLVEGDISRAVMTLRNMTDRDVIVTAWEITLDGSMLAGEPVGERLRADGMEEKDGVVTLTAHWTHDSMQPMEARRPMPSFIDGKTEIPFRPVRMVVPANSNQEWSTRFPVPLGGRQFQLAARVSILVADSSIAPHLFTPDPKNPSLDPDEAMRRWSERLPNAPVRRDPAPQDDPVTLRYLRGGKAVAGAILREVALETPAILGEEARLPGARREFTLDAASEALGLRGRAAWAGAWVVTDGASTGFALPDSRFTLPGDLVDVFHSAFFGGLGTFFFHDPVPPAIESAFGPGGPLKGGGTEITVPAEKLFDFAKALADAGWTLTGKNARPR